MKYHQDEQTPQEADTSRSWQERRVPASSLFVLSLKRDEADEQAPQAMAGSLSPLAAFLAEAVPRYEMLAQTLGLVTEAIRKLEQDRLPRDAAFWQAMAAGLAVMKQAVDACLVLTDEERFPSPVLDAIDAAAMKECVLLRHTRSCIDEVDLRLTSYQKRSSLAQKHLRQQQEVLHALRTLHTTGQDALKQSRVLRDALLEYMYSPVPSVTIPEGTDRQRLSQRAGGTAITRKRRKKNDSRGNRGTILHLVPREAQTEETAGADRL